TETRLGDTTAVPLSTTARRLALTRVGPPFRNVRVTVSRGDVAASLSGSTTVIGPLCGLADASATSTPAAARTAAPIRHALVTKPSIVNCDPCCKEGKAEPLQKRGAWRQRALEWALSPSRACVQGGSGAPTPPSPTRPDRNGAGGAVTRTTAEPTAVAPSMA